MASFGRISTVLAMILFATVYLRAQDPDIQALINIAYAPDVKTAARYFPPEIEEAIAKLSKEQRIELNRDLPLLEMVRKESQGTVEISLEPGAPFLLFHDPKGGWFSHLEFYIVDRVYGNDQSEVTFQIKESEDSTESETVILRLKYVYPDWRLYEVESPKEHDVEHLDDAKLVEKLMKEIIDTNEKSAASQIRSYAESLQQYSTSYEEYGLPATLAQLGPPAEFDEADEEHAGLIEGELAKPPYEHERYRYQYKKIDSLRFTITARPVKYGVTGKKSFFVDESLQVRYTEKDQAPDALNKVWK